MFCHDCSSTRSLIPPSALVLRDVVDGGGRLGGVVGGRSGPAASFSPAHRDDDDDGGACDASVTYVGPLSAAAPSHSSSSSARRRDYGDAYGDDAVLHRGRNLEARVLLARHPQRTCRPCGDRLAPLQRELRSRNSNAVRYNYVDGGDAVRRMCNSPLAFTLGHEVRKAAYALGNLLPGSGGRRGGGRRGGAYINDERDRREEDVIYSYHPPPAEGECRVPSIFASGPGGGVGGGGGCRTIDPTFRTVDGMRVPAGLLARARGVAVVTCCKGGLGFAGFEFGTGLVVARRDGPERGPDGWSAPSAIGIAGVAWGALLGAQVSDHVFLLMTDDAVRLFASEGGKSVQLGADVGVALGPIGRTAGADLVATAGPSRGLDHRRGCDGDGGSASSSGGGVAMAPIFTYSLSKGLYAGVSLDGRLLVTRDRVNERFYGGAVSAHDLLSGGVPNPPAAQPLYDALKRCRVYGGGGGGGGEFGEFGGGEGGRVSGSGNSDSFGDDGYGPEGYYGADGAAGGGGVGGFMEHLSHATGVGLPTTSAASSRYSTSNNSYNLHGRENFTPGFY